MKLHGNFRSSAHLLEAEAAARSLKAFADAAPERQIDAE